MVLAMVNESARCLETAWSRTRARWTWRSCSAPGSAVPRRPLRYADSVQPHRVAARRTARRRARAMSPRPPRQLASRRNVPSRSFEAPPAAGPSTTSFPSWWCASAQGAHARGRRARGRHRTRGAAARDGVRDRLGHAAAGGHLRRDRGGVPHLGAPAARARRSAVRPGRSSSWSRDRRQARVDGLFTCTLMAGVLLMAMGLDGAGTAVDYIPRQ